jgi:hypothetical protein
MPFALRKRLIVVVKRLRNFNEYCTRNIKKVQFCKLDFFVTTYLKKNLFYCDGIVKVVVTGCGFPNICIG